MQVNKVPPTMTAEELHLLLERPGVPVSIHGVIMSFR